MYKDYQLQIRADVKHSISSHPEIVQHGVVSALKKVELVSDSLSCRVLRGR